jgi:hypothetical protein
MIQLERKKETQAGIRSDEFVSFLQRRNFVDNERGKGTSTMEGGGQTIGEACRQGGEHTA